MCEEGAGWELCGDRVQRAAQRELARSSAWLRSKPDLVSQGRTLILFHAAGADVPNVCGLVERFRRVLIHGKSEPIAVLAADLERAGFEVERKLTLMAGATDAALERIEAMPAGWSLSHIGPDTSIHEISALQRLHSEAGLSPLPAHFLRGCETTRTIALKDDRGRLAGSATVQDLGAREGSRRIAMALSVCIDEKYRGRRLSYLLNSAAIRCAHDLFEASEIWEIVEDGNEASFAMNRRCGLQPQTGGKFIFVQVRA